MSLHIKYRPTDWRDFFGNSSLVQSLQSELRKENKAHVYMFYGPSGCGKTTLARLLAKELKCNERNIFEYDIADTTSIEDARKIKESVRFKPMLTENDSNVKVYIFDEFHRASNNAKDALLKTLEEPPTYVYFVICTTEFEKIPTTIKSRCLKYQVQALDNEDIIEFLENIIEKENLDIHDKVIRKIAKKSNGAPREALQLLNQVSTISDVDLALDLITHNIEEAEIIEICRTIANFKLSEKDRWFKVADLLSRLKNANIDTEKYRIACLSYFSSMMINKKLSISIIQRAALIAECFEQPFYNSGRGGLILACYKACME